MTKSEEYRIKYAAFNEELEKLGYSMLLGRLLSQLPKLTSGLKTLGSGANKFISRYGTKTFENPLFKSTGTQFNVLRANNKFRPMLGIKKRPVVGYRNVTQTSFSKNPIKAIGERVLSGTANTMSRAKNFVKNPAKYTKEEIFRAKHYSKVVDGPGGKQYEVFMKRSLPGRIFNPVFDTGLGFGGLSLATSKYDEQGRKNSGIKRVGQAIKDTVAWGPFRSLSMAKFTAVDMPKEIKNTIKGF